MTIWNTSPFLKKKAKNYAKVKVNAAIKPAKNTMADYKYSFLEMSLTQLKNYLK